MTKGNDNERTNDNGRVNDKLFNGKENDKLFNGRTNDKLFNGQLLRLFNGWYTLSKIQKYDDDAFELIEKTLNKLADTINDMHDHLEYLICDDFKKKEREGKLNPIPWEIAKKDILK